MGQKRHREVPTAIVRRAEVYEDLANVDQTTRLKAAHALLSEIVPQADPDGLLEILRRLIKGLCSGRKAARLGFSVALTEFLTALYAPGSTLPARFRDVSRVIDTLLDQTQASGGLAGQEDRDHHIGRLFGAEAIIKSGILFHGTNDAEQYGRILDIIYDLAKKKSWLREQCGFILHQSLEKSSTLGYIHAAIEKLQSAGLAKTPEGVAIWITVQRKFPSVTVPKDVWHHDSPLHRREKSHLALILKEASVSELDGANPNLKPHQRGSWSANVHFAWLVVITELLSHSESKGAMKSAKCMDFGEFWNHCVEDGLFKSSSSDERKYWGLELFQRSLNIASTPSIVSNLFSTKLVQCLANHLASSDRYLHRVAQKARKTILDKAQTDTDIKITIIESLLMNGFIDFDKISKTRTIEELNVGLDEYSATRLCAIYDVVILNAGVHDERHVAQRRQIAADQLVTAIRSVKLDSSRAQLEESSQQSIRMILSLITRFAYFDPGSRADPRFTSASHDLFKSRLSSSLTYLAANAKDLSLFVYALVLIIKEKKTIPGDAKLLLEAEDAVQELLDRAVNTMLSIHAYANRTEQSLNGFFKSALLLMGLTFLQVYNNDVDAVSMLEELNETFSKKQLKHYEKQGFESSTALVEILLGLVAKPSKLFRRVTQQVFENIAPDVDENGLLALLRILKTKENQEGQEALFDQDSDNEEDGEPGSQDDGDEQNLDSDALNVDASDEKMIQQEDPESAAVDDTASSSAAEEQTEEGQDDELAAFNAKLAQALGTRPGNEDLDAEDSDDSDEGMNDEEMEALDMHLEKVFREQKKVASKKGEKKDAKKTIFDFKCRVLELLDLFVKKRHRSSLALVLIVPLLTLIRTTTSPQVSQKAGDVLREYTRLCKGKELPVITDGQKIFEMLQSVHQEALIQASNAHGTGCSQASLLLARVVAGHEPDQLGQVMDIYGSTFSASQRKAMVEPTFKVKMALFTDFNNWVNSLKK